MPKEAFMKQNLMDVEFANLNDTEVNQVKQFEATLNSQHGDKNSELILLAFSKTN